MMAPGVIRALGDLIGALAEDERAHNQISLSIRHDDPSTGGSKPSVSLYPAITSIHRL